MINDEAKENEDIRMIKKSKVFQRDLKKSTLYTYSFKPSSTKKMAIHKRSIRYKIPLKLISKDGEAINPKTMELIKISVMINKSKLFVSINFLTLF